MLSIPLLKRMIKVYWKEWYWYTGVLLLLVLMGVVMYDTRMASAIQTMPEGLMLALSMKIRGSGLTEFLGATFYGCMMVFVPMYYEIRLANKMIAQRIEEKSMVFLIAGPNSRNCIIGTKAFFLIISLFLMFLAVMLAGLLLCFLWRPGQLVISQFILLNFGAFCMHVCLSGIAFLVSCISDEHKLSALVGAGVSLLFYCIHMIANLEGIFGFFRFLTPFSLYDVEGIVQGELFACVKLPIPLLLGLGLYLAGMKLFEKRDLPL